MKILARLRILCNADHGAALVELAFMTPVLLLLVLGAVDFGRAFYVYLEVVNAAHAGAQYGSLNPSNTAGITTAATHKQDDNGVVWTTPAVAYGMECSDGTSYTPSATSLTCVANANRSGTAVYRVKVTTSAVYTTLVPWPGIPNSITLSATATARGNN
jgi:Flp pilus assembly protein TadG